MSNNDDRATREHDNAERLRTLMDSKILQMQRGSAGGLFYLLRNECEGASPTRYDHEVALTYWWQLARTGLIALLGGEPRNSSENWILTKEGRAALARKSGSPHRPGYLAELRRRVPDLDPTVLVYLQEAVGAWQSGLYRSSVVMLGGASERLILLLAESVIAASIPPYSDKLKEAVQGGKSGRSAPISAVFDLVNRALTEDPTALTPSLQESIDRTLTPIFEYARGLRNKSGHPTPGNDITFENAEAGLLLFPGFSAYVYDVRRHLSLKSGTAT